MRRVSATAAQTDLVPVSYYGIPLEDDLSVRALQ